MIQFNMGETSVVHNITIINDDLCETEPDEFFLSDIVTVTGVGEINIVEPQARVTIEDASEEECGKYLNHKMRTLFIFSLGAINIGYETTSYLTSESQGVVELTIVLIPSGPAPRPFTLFVSTTDNTAGIYLAEVQLNLTTCFLSSSIS